MPLKQTSIFGRSVLSAAVAASSGMAVAQALPPAQYAGHYVVNADLGSPTMQITGPGVYTQTRVGQNGGGVASATVAIGTTPAPSVTYSASVSAPGVNPASAAELVQGDLPFGTGSLFLYSLEFLGPVGQVPIQVDALVQASLSPFAQGSFDTGLQASLTVNRGASPVFGDYINVEVGTGNSAAAYTTNYAGATTFVPYSATSGISAAVSDSHVWMAQTNVIYTVAFDLFGSMDVSGLQGGGSMSESALIDPTFQISALATNPSLYSVIVSDGIGDSTVAAVPEPETYALLFAGLGLTGAISRRRRRAQRSAMSCPTL